MYRFYRSSRNGFTLIEVLFSLAITLTIIFNVYSILRLTNVKNTVNKDIDLYITAKQLSEYIISSNDIYVTENQIEYTSLDHKDFKIYFDEKNRLVKEDGYEIIGLNIDDGEFYEDDELVYMKLVRNDKEYNFLIGYINEYEENDEEE